MAINKMPIDYKEFKKNPLVGMLFILMFAIGSLWAVSEYNHRQNENRAIETITMLTVKSDQLSAKVEELGVQLRKSESALAATNAKIQTLIDLGKIKR